MHLESCQLWNKKKRKKKYVTTYGRLLAMTFCHDLINGTAACSHGDVAFIVPSASHLHTDSILILGKANRQNRAYEGLIFANKSCWYRS